MKNELSHMHQRVKFPYYHSLYKRGGKIFIEHVLLDMFVCPSRIYNRGKGDPLGYMLWHVEK